ncbi:hypothetical protein [Paenibacillus radicis (ex Gao et al. 2016)]|uniref:Serine protease n=1 Tax=Paenibacillus radicis (ex Gao et al. 2016) TaxID=1737354 RepID=A0A917H2C2_9BACL|nr:hypothetical protein [Paenibacillus radicis (ex Gao et al. 2016)]GGG65688.1 hypothetical protein GCM10010918_20000 [Paenibacillus radicis (ex Gao et al. 2016)]
MVKRKGTFLASLILVIALLIPSATLTANPGNSIDLEILESSIEYRELHGLNSSTKYVSELLLSDNTYERIVGIPLTKDEFLLLEERDQLLDSISDYRESLKAERIPNGDLFYDIKTGEVTLNLVEATDNTIKRVKEKFPKPEKLKIKRVTFTSEALSEALEKLRNSYSDLDGLKTIHIDTQKNRIIIGLKDSSPDIRKKVTSLVDSEMLEFTEASDVSPLAISDLSNNHRPLVAGTKIFSDYSGGCSTGFYANTLSGNIVLVTAGHCTTVGSNGITTKDAWYQPTKSSSNKIGNSLYRNSGNSFADSLTVSLDSSTIKSTDVFEATSSTTVTYPVRYVESPTAEVVGMETCKTGFTTGTTCGQYQGKTDVLSYGSGYTTMYDLRLASWTANHGDSGGTVFKKKFNSQYGRVDVTLQGLVGGEVTIGGTNYRFYSHVSNIAGITTPVTL